MAGHLTEPHEMSDKERQHHYEVEDAARSLTKAEEIRGNKKLYDEAIALLKEQQKDLAVVIASKK